MPLRAFKGSTEGSVLGTGGKALEEGRFQALSPLETGLSDRNLAGKRLFHGFTVLRVVSPSGTSLLANI